MKTVKSVFLYLRKYSTARIIKRSKLFDDAWYLLTYSDVAKSGIDPLVHYVWFGSVEGRNPTPMFDVNYYKQSNPDIDFTKVEPFTHYLKVGHKQLRNPNPLFSEGFVKGQSRNENLSVSGLERYLLRNPNFDVNPSQNFDNERYFSLRPDVLECKIAPLKHYLSSGRAEFDFFQARESLVEPRPENVVKKVEDKRVGDLVIYKAGGFSSKNVLLYVCYASDGGLSEFHIRNINKFDKENFEIVLIVCFDNLKRVIDEETYKRCNTVILRENFGFDFGAWKDTVNTLHGLENAKSITFSNDSFLVTSQTDLSHFVEKLDLSTDGATFATGNKEIKNHEQSFFFSIAGKEAIRQTLKVLNSFPYYLCKQLLIEEVEIVFGDMLRENGVKVNVLYKSEQFENYPANLTIHKWDKLIEEGFPFLKSQGLQAGLIDYDELSNHIDPEAVSILKDHLDKRGKIPIDEVGKFDDPNPFLNDLFYVNGALRAYNPASCNPVSIPLEKVTECTSKVLAIIHCYYLDVASEIIEKIAIRKGKFFAVFTTDTQDKVFSITKMANEHELDFEVICTNNRGRDIRPMLEALKKHRSHFDFMLHLHTKKSPHNSLHEDWGKYLIDTMIGSGDVIDSNVTILTEPEVGVVYPEHHATVRGLRNWGYNFDKAKKLLAGKFRLSQDTNLDFPTGMMFFAKVELFTTLLDMYPDSLDFEEEDGQVDGTLAHAIERCIFYFAARVGLGSVSVSTEGGINGAIGNPIMRKTLSHLINKARSAMLSKGRDASSIIGRAVGEIYPLDFCYQKALEKPRFNLVIPTAKPEKVYGGISTAIKAFLSILPAEHHSIRIIITSDDVDRASVDLLTKYFNKEFIVNAVNLGDSGNEIVQICHRKDFVLEVSDFDVFFATAWWTADVAYRAYDFISASDGKPNKVIYLIQDYEPGFYTWSNHSALARSTYARGKDTIAVINSEELAGYVLNRHKMPNSFVIPFRINTSIYDHLIKLDYERFPKENQILVYARPSVQRNLFEIIVEGLHLWQKMNPQVANQYEIVLAGEPFDNGLISHLINARVVGKMSLEMYALNLARSRIGVSLMESPHPSYPPLEMAFAGCKVVTNSYEGKNLEKRSNNIISLDPITPISLSDAIDKLTSSEDLNDFNVEYGTIRDLGAQVTELQDLAKGLSNLLLATDIKEH